MSIAEGSQYEKNPILSAVGLKMDSFGFIDGEFNIDEWMYKTMTQIIGTRSEIKPFLGYRSQFVELYENATDEQRAQFLGETRFGQLFPDLIGSSSRRWDKSPFQGLPAIHSTRSKDIESLLRPKELKD